MDNKELSDIIRQLNAEHCYTKVTDQNRAELTALFRAIDALADVMRCRMVTMQDKLHRKLEGE